MSSLYNLQEIHLNNKPIKTVHVAPITSETWKSSTHPNRNAWNPTDIVTMNALRNLVTADRSVEFQWSDMLQNGTYYYDSDVITQTTTTTSETEGQITTITTQTISEYDELYYHGTVQITSTITTTINQGVTEFTNIQTISLFKGQLNIHSNGVMFISPLITNIQSSDYDNITSFEPFTITGSTVTTIILSDNIELITAIESGAQVTPMTISLTPSTMFNISKFSVKQLPLNVFACVANSNVSPNTTVEITYSDGTSNQTITTTVIDSMLLSAGYTITNNTVVVTVAYGIYDYDDSSVRYASAYFKNPATDEIQHFKITWDDTNSKFIAGTFQ